MRDTTQKELKVIASWTAFNFFDARYNSERIERDTLCL